MEPSVLAWKRKQIVTYQPKFKFWDGKTMSQPWSLDDLAYEGFPSQKVNEHGDVSDALALQFTGTWDKNETEIYSGDICLYYKPNSYADGKDPVEVRWHNTKAAFHYWNKDTWYFISSQIYTIGNNKAGAWCEVIGNIYENPELLK